MKLFLSILLVFYSFSVFAQKLRTEVGLGEYVQVGLRNGIVYDFSAGKATPFSGFPTCKNVIGGAHHGAAVDINDTLWTVDDNSAGQLAAGDLVGRGTPFKVTRDSIGNGFGNVAQAVLSATIYGLFWNTWVVKKDGSLWGCGNLEGGAEGNNTWGNPKATRFVRIQFPAGVFITKVQAGYVMIALDSTGAVWTWGSGGNANVLGQGSSPTWMMPHKITITGRVIDIAGGGNWNYALTNTGQIYGWGGQFYADYLGVYPTVSSLGTSPINITSYLNFPVAPRALFANNETSYALLVDSTIWAWGGNAVGSVGNGIELDFSRYGGYPLPYGTSNPFPYNWDQGKSELQQLTTVQLAPFKHDFVSGFTSPALCYTMCWEDVNNNLFFNGRNKRGIPNGVIDANPNVGNIGSSYPNSWDVPWLTPVDPFTVPAVIQVSSPYCITHAGTSPCNIYTIPNVAGPTSNAGTNQNIALGIATVNGSASSSSGTAIIYYIWSQVSGPTTAIFMFNSAPSSNVYNLTTGTYIFKLKVIDANWRTDSSTTIIRVGVVLPTVSAGSNQTIVLPTNNVTLTGTASAPAGAIITSTVWTHLSGPGGSTITTPNSLTTTVTGLVTGVHTFRLTVTDSNGNSNTSDMVVTVITPTSTNYLLRRRKTIVQ